MSLLNFIPFFLHSSLNYHILFYFVLYRFYLSGVGGQWCMDAVERREYASKKAQLAAAELAKLSKRVCGEHLDIDFQVSVLGFISRISSLL